ncbi:terpenoid synthase 30 [Dorcoceras hygrometricum]|uniref:Terpenoid synthase 30 n=1 Tax=Dorcoceras hygrometricum TaxID=472368 RepID=A0A2Z7D693_9LAMI|nr:terpenoid synthase 30 [Dorcoceras hygrometricum]
MIVEAYWFSLFPIDLIFSSGNDDYCSLVVDYNVSGVISPPKVGSFGIAGLSWLSSARAFYRQFLELLFLQWSFSRDFSTLFPRAEFEVLLVRAESIIVYHTPEESTEDAPGSSRPSVCYGLVGSTVRGGASANGAP